jgi:hypothetical protein
MSFQVGEDERSSLALILTHMNKEKVGQLVITLNDRHEWVVGYEFGKEAEDSPMSAGASYGLSSALYQALDQVVKEIG